MREQYKGRLLDDGHLPIPKVVVDKLKIDRKSRLCITVDVEKTSKKDKILSYAGLLSDLTEEEEKKLNEGIGRKSLFGQRKAEI